MRTRRPVFPSAPALLAGLALVALFLLPACSDRGPHSLNDVTYWRVKLSHGEGIDEIVAQGSAAVPLLNTLLADSNEYVVQHAAMAVQQIGASAAGTVPAMVNALIRYPGQPYVTQALKAMKGDAVEHLVPFLSDGDAEVQKQAIEALNGIGPAAEPAVEPLLRIVEDTSGSTEIRRLALVTLGSIGERAVSAIPRINEVALKEDALRQSAAMAMKRLKWAKRVREKGGDR